METLIIEFMGFYISAWKLLMTCSIPYEEARSTYLMISIKDKIEVDTLNYKIVKQYNIANIFIN